MKIIYHKSARHVIYSPEDFPRPELIQEALTGQGALLPSGYDGVSDNPYLAQAFNAYITEGLPIKHLMQKSIPTVVLDYAPQEFWNRFNLIIPKSLTIRQKIFLDKMKSWNSLNTHPISSDKHELGADFNYYFATLALKASNNLEDCLSEDVELLCYAAGLWDMDEEETTNQATDVFIQRVVSLLRIAEVSFWGAPFKRYSNIIKLAANNFTVEETETIILAREGKIQDLYIAAGLKSDNELAASSSVGNLLKEMNALPYSYLAEMYIPRGLRARA